MGVRLPIVLALLLVVPLLGVPESSAQLAPENDDRANARQIPGLPYDDEESTLFATDEDDEPSPSCTTIGATVWYSYAPSETARVRVDTLGSDFDTVLAVYEEGGSEVACNDQWNSDQSLVGFRAEAGELYLVQAGGWYGDTGNLVLNAEAPEPIGNDDRAEATVIEALPFTDDLNTFGATEEADEPQPCGEIGATVWYSHTAQASGLVRADTRRSEWGYDTVLAVYDAAGNVVACNDDTKLDSGFYEERAWVEVDVTAGETYLFQVGGYAGDTGHLVFDLRAGDSGGTTNDERGEALVIGGLPYTATQGTEDATLSPDEPRPCGVVRSTVWFSFTPDRDLTLLADTYGSDFDTVIAVYEQGSDDAVACNDDADGTQAAVQFDAVAGTTYEFQVGGYLWETGALTFHLDEAPPPDPGPAFAALEDAEIRPGIRLHIDGHGRCTSNFVFRGMGPQAGKVYIGVAAHCVGWDVGTPVRTPPNAPDGDPPVIGHVAYSSFKEIATGSSPCFVILSCSTGVIDFALVEITEAFEASVNPALLRFGGPTGIVPFEEVGVGDRVLTYGNTPLRPGPEEIDAREGYVTEKEPADTSDGYQDEIYAYFVGPGIFGDSGSAVIAADGRAMGALVTIGVVPPGRNGMTSLSRALDFAATHGWEVELGTWEILDPGVFPDVN